MINGVVHRGLRSTAAIGALGVGAAVVLSEVS